MNSNRHEPNGSDVLASLRLEAIQDLDPELESRLWERLEFGIAGLSGTVLDGLDGAEKGISKPSLTDTYAARLALHPIATLVTTLTLGAALGATALAAIERPRKDSQARTNIEASASLSPVANAPPAVIQPTATTPEQLPLLAATPSANRSKSRATAALQPEPVYEPAPNLEASKSGLAEEVAQLEEARAFLHKDACAALSTLDAHAHRYPNSSLKEERDALVIRALVLAHRAPEARTQLVQFERQFPNSLLLPALRDSVGATP